MTEEHEWHFDVFVQVDLFGRGANVERRLHEGVAGRQRRVLGERAWRSLTA